MSLVRPNRSNAFVANLGGPTAFPLLLGSVAIGLGLTALALRFPQLASRFTAALLLGGLLGGLLGLGLAALLLRGSSNTREADRALRQRGRSFALAFFGNNLLFASLFAGLAIWLVRNELGTWWGQVLLAGSITCMAMPLFGLMVFKRTRGLALCWQIFQPAQLDLLEQSATTLILRERFEHARRIDLHAPTSMLARMTRWVDLSSTNTRPSGSLPRLALLPTIPHEWLWRLRSLGLVFVMASVIALLFTPLFGSVAPSTREVASLADPLTPPPAPKEDADSEASESEEANSSSSEDQTGDAAGDSASDTAGNSNSSSDASAASASEASGSAAGESGNSDDHPPAASDSASSTPTENPKTEASSDPAGSAPPASQPPGLPSPVGLRSKPAPPPSSKPSKPPCSSCNSSKDGCSSCNKPGQSGQGKTPSQAPGQAPADPQAQTSPASSSSPSDKKPDPNAPPCPDCKSGQCAGGQCAGGSGSGKGAPKPGSGAPGEVSPQYNPDASGPIARDGQPADAPKDNVFSGKTPTAKKAKAKQSTSSGGWGLGDPGDVGPVTPPSFAPPSAANPAEVVEIKFPNAAGKEGDQLKPIDEQPPQSVKDILRGYERTQPDAADPASKPGKAAHRIPAWVLEFKK